MELRRGPRDDAVSEVVGVVVMITVTAALAATLFLWVGIGESPPESSLAVALRSEGPVSASTKTISVTSVSDATTWSEVALQLDGRTLQYDSTLSGNAKFCVKDGGEHCIPTAEWNAAAMKLEPGQLIRIRDPSIEGTTLRMVQGEANLLVTTMKMGTQ